MKTLLGIIIFAFSFMQLFGATIVSVEECPGTHYPSTGAEIACFEPWNTLCYAVVTWDDGTSDTHEFGIYIPSEGSGIIDVDDISKSNTNNGGTITTYTPKPTTTYVQANSLQQYLQIIQNLP